MYIVSQIAQCQKLGGNQIYMAKWTLISSFPSVNLLYIWKLSIQPDYRHPEGSKPGQPLTTGPKSDYLLITDHSLPLSWSWLLPHLHNVWQYLHLLKQHDRAQGTLNFNCDDCGQSFWIQKEGSQNWINWGVSETPKPVPKQHFFFKHQFVLNNYTIFMKQIGSNVKLLNHSWQILWREFWYFSGIFFVFKTRLTALWLLCLTIRDQIARKHHINIYFEAFNYTLCIKSLASPPIFLCTAKYTNNCLYWVSTA